MYQHIKKIHQRTDKIEQALEGMSDFDIFLVKPSSFSKGNECLGDDDLSPSKVGLLIIKFDPRNNVRN